MTEGNTVPEQVRERFVTLTRELSAATVLFHSQVAGRVGLSATDHKCLDLAVSADRPIKTLREFIDYVKAHPGEVNYGSAGIGSTHHLTMEAMKSALHLDLTHIPYRGTSQAVPEASIFSTLGDRATASSANSFVVTRRPRRGMPSHVISTLDSLSCNRAATASAPNPEKMGV